MGKGSNVQKAQAARERNQKKMGKTDEERKAARDKHSKDSAAYMCQLCRQTFMVNAKLPVLYLHVTSKHEPGTLPASCFVQLKDYDPNDPKGEKKAAKANAKPVSKKSKKKEDLSDLFDAGLSMGKTKKKGFKK
uniref:At2g23090-like zinc-binding domain-containing protein n=1 Tax=Odontella aurita TaxID=265563 RepID=A0A7S4JVX6_9STRA|mmetsp:Transcript_5549/g.16126  ORF Transcript_5549/g.16126 Transcript_5549/m.16126 type:complete len:134 (+) Transcript_5549:296-697(+)|eukprot:CAMPEP_0113564678 /NCGR_PEP_ID=MMETSP0015_2-20120614/21753_1 /TAXON_ID=2838 /ORGANISM="Odontella" /LENGTH=133 /DNA_ID=CAMNT_0000466787 /DNA_START=174 /DNA_END=575 /DNA_ORIENTATION=+ /assembly_acc=CAM_ASM_000160